VPPLLLLKRFAQALVGDRRKEAAREDGIDRSGVEVERPDEGFSLVRSGAQEIDELVREIEPLLGCPGIGQHALHERVPPRLRGEVEADRAERIDERRWGLCRPAGALLAAAAFAAAAAAVRRGDEVAQLGRAGIAHPNLRRGACGHERRHPLEGRGVQGAGQVQRRALGRGGVEEDRTGKGGLDRAF
jgi:hypothetical protein